MHSQITESGGNKFFSLAPLVDSRHVPHSLNRGAAPGGSFGSEFPAICNYCVVMAAWSRKPLKFCENLFVFFSEKRPLR